MNKLIALFVFCALIMATLDMSDARRNKGGDTLILGGGGGGGRSLIKTNGKKGGSTILLGVRRRRSVEAVQQPLFTIYQAVNEKQ